MRRTGAHERSQIHHVRFMSSLMAVLLVLIIAIRLWPPPGEAGAGPLVYDTRGQEVIELEEILPTRQSATRPPPPPPPIPIVVPDDVVLEEIEIDLADDVLITRDPGDDELPPGPPAPTAGDERARPEVGPRTVRFVEPEYTREARRRRVRAEVVVEVLVDERGQVRETRIVERFLLGSNPGDKQPVEAVGYGLEEAALAAAERWVFRPARQDGRAVRSYTTLTFTFGV